MFCSTTSSSKYLEVHVALLNKILFSLKTKETKLTLNLSYTYMSFLGRIAKVLIPFPRLNKKKEKKLKFFALGLEAKRIQVDGRNQLLASGHVS